MAARDATGSPRHVPPDRVPPDRVPPDRVPRRAAAGDPHAAELARLRRLRMAKDIMDRDWAAPLDLEAVAARAGYSAYHFVRLFKAAYGETPGRYLTRRRVERAQDLLRAANLTISEICLAVGFESLGSFCTRFKQVTGMTPGEYRRANRGGAAGAVPGCFALLWAGGFRLQPVPVNRREADPGDADDAAILEKPADRPPS